MITFYSIPIGVNSGRTCSRCVTDVVPAQPAPLEEIRQSIAALVVTRDAANSTFPFDFVLLDGFEPFMHPDLVGVIEMLSQAGIGHIGMRTDGGALSSPQAAQGCIGAGVRIFEVPILSANPELSDRITATPGLHMASLRGIDMIQQAGNTLGVKTFVSAFVPVCSHNADDLLGAVQTAIAAGVDAIRLESADREYIDRRAVRIAHELATRSSVALFGDGCEEFINGATLYTVRELPEGDMQDEVGGKS